MTKNSRSRITDLKLDLESSEDRISNLASQIDTLESEHGTITSHIEDSQKKVAQINELKILAENELVKLQAIESKAKSSEETIANLISAVSDCDTEFKERSSSIVEIEDKIAGFEKKIVEQLGRASSGVLANAFYERQNEVEAEVSRWRKNLYWSTCLLVVVGISFFAYSFWASFDYQFLLKITVSLPLIYSVWFSSRQYERERKIVEQYSFKAAKAKSLSAFSKIVKECSEGSDGSLSTQNFVISSVSGIYDAPNLEYEKDSFPSEKILKVAKELSSLSKK